VFLFFLYLATTALNLAIPVQVITSTGSITQLIGLMIPPILKGLMIGFILLKGRDIAKQMAGTIGTLVSDTAMKAVGSVAQFSAGVATAGGAWALRSTVGAGARSAAMSFKERAEDKNASGFSRFVNRQMYNATARIGKSTFDPRNTKAYDGLQGWTKKNEFDIGKTPYFGNKWNPEVEWRKKKAKEKEKQQNQPNNAPTNTTTTPPPPGGPAPVARPPTTPPGGRSGRPGLPPSGPTRPGAPGASPGRPAPGGGSSGGTPGAPNPNPTAGPGLATTQAPANQGQNPGNPSGSSKPNSPYNTLGVNESATDEEVRAAYREAMKKNFRAANQEGDSEEKKAASSAMQAAQEAFDQIRKMRELAGKFKVTAHIKGGGIHSQAEALRHGIARALEKNEPVLRKTLKKVGYLKRDPRAKERRKFGLKKARKSPQWSKR
jgi:ribosomal protein S9